MPRLPQPRLQEDPAQNRQLCRQQVTKSHQALCLGPRHEGAGTDAKRLSVGISSSGSGTASLAPGFGSSALRVSKWRGKQGWCQPAFHPPGMQAVWAEPPQSEQKT